MSRSAELDQERRPRPTRRAGLARPLALVVGLPAGLAVGLPAGLGVGLPAGLPVAPLIAAAEPVTPAPVLDVVAPVSGIIAPVLDIQFADSDLRREARVEKRPKSVKVTLDSTVLFAKDSARIRPGAAKRLHEVAADLKAEGPGAIRIVGYTDDLGTAAHGLALSRRRARAVADVLRRDLPAAGYAYTVVGKGEADPAVPNKSEANRRINRRVVVTYQAQ
jgi:outer membrane protein OmpA-like peptidoglycan-associated protein